MDMLRYQTAQRERAPVVERLRIVGGCGANSPALRAYSPVHNVKAGTLLSADVGDDRRS